MCTAGLSTVPRVETTELPGRKTTKRNRENTGSRVSSRTETGIISVFYGPGKRPEAPISYNNNK